MRLRLTTHLPLEPSRPRIGLTVWIGSVATGWTGYHLNPRKWNRTWRITSSGNVL